MRALLESGALAGTWVLDPGASEVRLRSKVRPGLPVRGVFREVSGTGTVTRDGTVSGTFTVAAGSVDTGNARRDRHLRSADFFDSDRYPDITFAVDRVGADRVAADRVGASGQVTGTLTIRGRSQPLSFAATVSATGDDELRLDAEVAIDRAEFGLTWNFLGTVPRMATVAVHAVFTRGRS